MVKENEKMNATKVDRSPRRFRRGTLAVLCAAVLLGALLTAPAQGAIGLKSFTGSVLEADGSSATQAGGHPFLGTTTFTLDSHAGDFGESVIESLKDAIVSLPAGFVGNPLAVPQCSISQFSDFSTGRAGCPPATQVGTVQLNTFGSFGGPEPLYNLIPPAGVPAAFGFHVTTVPVTLTASVRTGGDYGIDLSALQTNQFLGIIGTKVTLWGDPSAPGHDSQRGECLFNGGTDPSTGEPCHTTPQLPMIGAPSDCAAGPLATLIHVNSWQNPGIVEVGSFVTDENGNPTAVTGCEAVPFEPSITATPTTNQADSPTGLSVEINMPQQGYEDADALNSAYLKEATVTLPEGMTVNPSAANGLGSCSQAQIELNGPNPAACPNDSKLGNVEIATPLLTNPLKGGVYLAAQGENKFGSLLAVYIAVNDPQTGVVVKLAGKIAPDPQTGRIVATFDENPQLPFTSLHVDFYGGPTAALRTPPSCGNYGITGAFSSWSAVDPEHPTLAEVTSNTSNFDIVGGPGGSPCPSGRFDPSLTAGTASPFGGTFSPFTMRLTREDGTQPLNGLSLSLPPGLTGRLAGVPYCPEGALAAISDAEGTGRAQLASPSCPAASQVGTVTVGAGAGTSPFYVSTGKAYLAGPYKGAPISLAIVTPAVAGPFDLGSVLVRTALQVNPETTQITAVSDPIPTIVHGIPLDLRDIRINVDRQEFTLNPTNCEEMGFAGQASAPGGAVAPLTSRFQAVSCASLAFKPQLKIQLKGSTKRIGHPALKAVVTYPSQGTYANLARAQVNLPHGEFLDQGNLNKTCTKPVLLAGNCPASSIYGKAKAWTPLLEKPLEGNVYLVGGYGFKLPALVADLNGQVHVTLVGKVDSGSNRGIRNTFELVPDAPVSRFVLEMKGGKKYGLLENSENLCKASKAHRQAIARFTGQNGKVLTAKPVVANQCGKSRGKAKKHGRHNARG